MVMKGGAFIKGMEILGSGVKKNKNTVI
jgi:hypothetical protein